ncbi:hypothetical protein BC827DRAFT_1155016 [Russula dissimulans]|nr:hypothetical protein BC827DRAFT_1155016 [Russula dissimulans]
MFRQANTYAKRGLWSTGETCQVKFRFGQRVGCGELAQRVGVCRELGTSRGRRRRRASRPKAIAPMRKERTAAVTSIKLAQLIQPQALGASKGTRHTHVPLFAGFIEEAFNANTFRDSKCVLRDGRLIAVGDSGMGSANLALRMYPLARSG